MPTDDELVGGLIAGDEAAFALVVDAWSPGMLRVARGFVSTAESAAEVVQDAWLAVIDGIDRFEGRSSLKTWVYRILINTAKRRGVREGRTIPWTDVVTGDDHGPTVDPARFRSPGEPYAGHWREDPSPWPLPEDETLAAELRGQVLAAIGTLPGRQQVVLALRDIEGYSSEEVCEMLDISAGNQRVLLHRARAAVRGRLEEYFAAAGAARSRSAGRSTS